MNYLWRKTIFYLDLISNSFFFALRKKIHHALNKWKRMKINYKSFLFNGMCYFLYLKLYAQLFDDLFTKRKKKCTYWNDHWESRVIKIKLVDFWLETRQKQKRKRVFILFLYFFSSLSLHTLNNRNNPCFMLPLPAMTLSHHDL
jgi:hypothetical protein